MGWLGCDNAGTEGEFFNVYFENIIPRLPPRSFMTAKDELGCDLAASIDGVFDMTGGWRDAGLRVRMAMKIVWKT